MCGIVGLFDLKEPASGLRARALTMAASVRHRGPDASGTHADERAILMHERLSIVDPAGGAQPLYDSKTGRVLVVNGEIYNHLALRARLTKAHEWHTRSDCEVLLYLYDEFGPAFLEWVDGIFAFAIHDPISGEHFIARDAIGVCPLYAGWDEHGTLHVASELKALDPFCARVQEFPPGTYYRGGVEGPSQLSATPPKSMDARLVKTRFVQWFDRAWMHRTPRQPLVLSHLREALEASVRRQLMADAPIGVLISGGLDSALIASITQRELDAAHARQHAGRLATVMSAKPTLHSFSVGLVDSPDLAFARTVARHVGTEHHEIVFTVQEGIDAIPDVIRHLETFDTTTIRAATPMYLMARRVRSYGVKVVLSGEGADEVFGGYLYFHMAPSAREFHAETVRKLASLSKYDCLRANKSMAAWGVEARVPFLDPVFLDYAMSLDPKQKMCPGQTIEKKILREAFDGYVPKEIVWRQKEQFSDGVGYRWIDQLKAHAEKIVTDEQFARASERFPAQTPTSKEQYWYRTVFDEFFHSPTAAATVPVGPSIACSTPTAFRWSQQFAKMDDPSGRSVHAIHRPGEGERVAQIKYARV